GHARGMTVEGTYKALVTAATGAPDQDVWVHPVDQSGADNASIILNGQQSNVGAPADAPAGIAVGPVGGEVYVVGSTASIDFPTTPNAPQAVYGSGASDAFISKVSFRDAAPPPPPPGSLPSPWVDQDIGAVGAAGSASFANGAFSVTGSGSDIWGAADSFNFMSQSIAGNA